MENILSVQSVTKRFGATLALDDVSLSIRQGEIIGLAGGNGSGKSTLIKILCGIYKPEAGNMFFAGDRYAPTNPEFAEKCGLSVFHQEIPICLHMSVAENVFLSPTIPNHFGMPNKAFMVKETERLFNEFLSEEIDATMLMKDCSVAQRQMAMLIKALSKNAKLIILDEPTTALTPTEVQKLFAVINRLREKGIAFIFVSHMLDEIITLCDRVIILRDGKYINQFERNGYTRDDLSAAIAGKTLTQVKREKTNLQQKPTALSLLNYQFEPNAEPFDLTLKQGEIIGLAGLAGSGRSELLSALFGNSHHSRGNCLVYEKECHITSPIDAINAGIGYLPEDRKTLGIFPNRDIKTNIGVSVFKHWSKKSIISLAKLTEIAESFKQKISIKCESVNSTITKLSGGNQQKVLLARWFAISPKIMLLNEPTRGVDVGAKNEILDLIMKMSEEGVSFIIASSELEELITVSDRILIMNKKRLVKELSGDDINKENIIKFSS